MPAPHPTETLDALVRAQMGGAAELTVLAADGRGRWSVKIGAAAHDGGDVGLGPGKDGGALVNLVLLALFALTQVFLALPAGRYADRKGLKAPLALSVAIAFTGVSLSAIWPVFPMLCVSALASGGATGMAVIALQRHVGRLANGPAELKSAFSWLSIGPAVSNFLGPVLAGLMK